MTKLTHERVSERVSEWIDEIVASGGGGREECETLMASVTVPICLH